MLGRLCSNPTTGSNLHDRTMSDMRATHLPMDSLSGVDLAITIPQPLATITVEGPRRFHNVTARPSVAHLGKRIAIYATPEPDMERAYQAMELLEASGISPSARGRWTTRKVMGAIIGTAIYAGIVMRSDDPWFVGPFALWLTDAVAIPTPLPMEAPSRRLFWRIPATGARDTR